ncbi:MAG: bifunctional glutamate N-acetyltransferase/amino-acid acetyltransferase ArgJ [Acidiferrobacter sp.]
MAVGFCGLPVLNPIAGIRLGTVMAGIRKAGRADLVVIQCSEGTTAAGAFTRSQFAAPPVVIARDHLRQASPRALVINTGFANAATGEQGWQDAQACCTALASHLHCRGEEILPFSTGVIGERLPTDRILAALPAAIAIGAVDGWADAANGIMTTDTVPKGASLQIEHEGRTATVTGIAKGSGMIHPDMATMLAFVATDLVAPKALLQAALDCVLPTTFNAITVDGDTSTNDAIVVLATGRSGMLLEPTGLVWERYVATLQRVCETLAQAVVRDGEGATKFVTVAVSGGRSTDECRRVAYTVALSPLVKTALFASDPNWGRILMAIGRSPIEPLDTTRVVVRLNGICVFTHGCVDPNYEEAAGQRALAQSEVTIGIELGHGQAHADVYTCDLSHDYVRINGSYRT